VEDVGVADAGPDIVQIPDDAEPGEYRICTVNTPERMCSAVDIVGSVSLRGRDLATSDKPVIGTRPASEPAGHRDGSASAWR
jgi:hypothetical protein